MRFKQTYKGKRIIENPTKKIIIEYEVPESCGKCALIMPQHTIRIFCQLGRFYVTGYKEEIHPECPVQKKVRENDI